MTVVVVVGFIIYILEVLLEKSDETEERSEKEKNKAKRLMKGKEVFQYTHIICRQGKEEKGRNISFILSFFSRLGDISVSFYLLRGFVENYCGASSVSYNTQYYIQI